MVERVYKASSLNVAIQDGADAGQSVPHLHTHIIPRQKADLDSRGGGDAIYQMLEGEEGDIGRQMRQRELERPKFPTVDNESRNPRSEDEMLKEAEWLTNEMAQEESR